MLCQVFTAADFSYLFVGLSAFSFVFSKWNAAQLGWDQEIDSAIAEYFTFLPLKTPGLLLLYVLGHRPFVLWSASQSTLLHLTESGAESASLQSSELIRLLLSSVSSSLNTVTQSHWRHAAHDHTAPCFRWCCVLSSWAVPSLLQTVFFPSF